MILFQIHPIHVGLLPFKRDPPRSVDGNCVPPGCLKFVKIRARCVYVAQLSCVIQNIKNFRTPHPKRRRNSCAPTGLEQITEPLVDKAPDHNSDCNEECDKCQNRRNNRFTGKLTGLQTCARRAHRRHGNSPELSRALGSYPQATHVSRPNIMPSPRLSSAKNSR